MSDVLDLGSSAASLAPLDLDRVDGPSARPLRLDPVELRARLRDEQALLERQLTALAGALDRKVADKQFRALLWGLAALARFGPFNQMCIRMQAPWATNVRGRRQWERLDRAVKPRARPIQIFAPGRPARPWPFIPCEVFDISQTDGPPLQTLASVYEGELRCGRALERAAGRLGIRLVERESLGGSGAIETLGVALGGLVVIRKDLAGAERARVLAHEYAHDLLHFQSGRPDGEGRGQGDAALRETEADATAYLVLGAHGVSVNSETYIVWHGGSGRMLMGSFRRICAAARTILQAMDGRRSRGRPDPKKGPPVPSPRATRRGRPASPPRSSPPRTS